MSHPVACIYKGYLYMAHEFPKGIPANAVPLFAAEPDQRQPLTNFDRFNGVDIQYRKSGTDWPMPYRVQVFVNKNEREEYRTTVFCDTLDEAIEAAHDIGANT